MKENDLNQNDAALSTMLREARSASSLPPRFQENVWRRIERAEEPRATAGNVGWLDVLAGWFVRPRLAFAVAAMLVLIGVGLGWSNGEQLVRNEAQSRYLSAVAPNALH